MKKEFTFLDLLSKYKILIPIIQRDYAQGRTDARTTRIREKFIKVLIETIFHDDKPNLHLNFIYGRVSNSLDQKVKKENEKIVSNLLSSIENYARSLSVEISDEMPEVIKQEVDTGDFFIPLDGQQRLTTLFLFHLILGIKVGDIDPRLDKFSYATRKSTRDFCSELIRNAGSLEKSEDFTETITNSSWFFSNWKNDPTVKGMLVTLNEFNLQLNGKSTEDFKNAIEILQNQNRISFEFLDLDKFELIDDLYVKMNARGKQLTDYQIFKSNLQRHIKYSKDCFVPTVSNWENKLEGEWLDLFWKKKKSGDFDIEPKLFDFIKNVWLYEYIIDDNLDIKDEELIKYLRGNEKSEIQVLDHSKMLALNFIDQSKINKSFELLDVYSDLEWTERIASWIKEYAYSNGDAELEESLLWIFFRNPSQQFDYPIRVLYYAILLFLHKFHGSDYDATRSKFKSWFRITQNLIYNQNYIQNPATFIKAIQGIKKLFNKVDNLEEYLFEANYSDIDFNTLQVKEEIEKIILIKNNPAWEKLIVEYERHPYFKGQIDFLLKLSDDRDIGLPEISKFEEYAKKVGLIFSDEVLQRDDLLFPRALLTERNYFIDEGRSKWRFCENRNQLRAKYEGWRTVFRRKENLNALKSLINQVSVENLVDDLVRIIDSYDNIDCWKYYFIKNSMVWDSCDNRRIKKTHKGYKVRLLKNANAGGTQRELRSKYFELTYSRMIKPFNKLTYYDVTKQEENPCAFFKEWKIDKHNFFLDIRYVDYKYELRLYDRNQISVNGQIAPILDKHNMVESSGYENISYIKTVEKLPELYIETDKLINDFKILSFA